MAGLMTASELALRLRCSTRTVNRMAQTRVLPALKRGRHWRFSEDAVAAFEAANTTAPATVQPARTGDGGGYRNVTTLRPAVEIGGEYVPVFAGPVAWRPTAINTAAAPAAGRGRASDTKKAASVSS